jgi:hypothetical protein
MRLTENYRRFKMPGAILLALLGAIGIMASTAIRLAWVPEVWQQVWQTTMLLARHSNLAMAIVLLGASVLLRWPAVPIRKSASRAALIVSGHAFYGFVVSGVTIAQAGQWWWWQSVLPVFGGFATAGLCVACLTRKSDECEEPAPVPAAPVRICEDAEIARAIRYIAAAATDLE